MDKVRLLDRHSKSKAGVEGRADKVEGKIQKAIGGLRNWLKGK
jgi:uncharacterized protein YjbJ (UPF0337 family)